MRITDIDPLQYGLLFERFLNPERVTLPDIDIDFCMNRRGEVIEYVTANMAAKMFRKSSPLEQWRRAESFGIPAAAWK
jgi:hypothetical protein